MTQLNVAQWSYQATDFSLRAWEFLIAMLPNIIAAAIVLAAGWWLAGILSRHAGNIVNKNTQQDPTLHGVVTKLVRYTILLLTFVIALSQLGVQTTSILAVLGAAGLAIALALQGTLSNIAAGFMLLWLRPFNVGDIIEGNGYSARVKEVGLFATTLTTLEGVYLFVPNSELWNTPITNFTRNPTRMVRETFTISYDDDIDKARAVLLSMVDADDRIEQKPPAAIHTIELGDNAVALELRAWTNTANWAAVRWDVIEHGKLKLEASGISIPYPQRDIHVHGLSLPANANS